MRPRKLITVCVLFLLTVPFLASCGPAKVDAALTSYKITLSEDNVPAGDVQFHIHNDATDLTHEFVIFKTDLAPDSLPLNDEGIVDEEGEGITFIDEQEDIEPGDALDWTVNLDAGNYVIVCNIDSDQMHYMHGMYVAFTVH